MTVLHAADVLGTPVRFFRSPLPGEDLPWHAVDDLQKAAGLSHRFRVQNQAEMRTKWADDVRLVDNVGILVLVAPHWMGQQFSDAMDAAVTGELLENADRISGPMFLSYCDAAKQANDALMVELGLTPEQRISRTVRAIARWEGALVDY